MSVWMRWRGEGQQGRQGRRRRRGRRDGTAAPAPLVAQQQAAQGEERGGEEDDAGVDGEGDGVVWVWKELEHRLAGVYEGLRRAPRARS